MWKYTVRNNSLAFPDGRGKRDMCLMRPVLNCYHHSYNLEKGQDAFMKYISRFLVRMIIGMACIFFLNQVFDNAGVELKVGCNVISVTTTGVLGVPGVLLLYGIEGCQFLPQVQ